MLGALALYLYWPDIQALTATGRQASGKPPAATATPIQAPPALSPADLQKLSPEERNRYQTMQQSLQQVLQNVHVLDQENTRLKQEIRQNTAENQELNPQIDKMRPGLPAATH